MADTRFGTINGGFSVNNISTTATGITLTATNFTVLCNAAGAGFTITLPAAATHVGRLYNIKKIDATGNVVVIDGNASELIDGSTTQTLDTQWEGVIIQSDGTAWYILSVN